MNMVLRYALALAFNFVLVATCSYALLKGGRPERLGAGANIVACLLTAALRIWTPAAWAPLHLAVLAIDAAVATSFFWLAVSTNRFWPIWAFGFALADILMSISGALLPHLPMFAFQSGQNIYAYLALAALTVGTWRVAGGAATGPRAGGSRSWRRTGET